MSIMWFMYSFSAESRGAECQVWDRHGYWEGKTRKETEKKNRVQDRKRRRRALQFYQTALCTDTHIFVYICLYVDIYIIYCNTYMYACMYTHRGPTYTQRIGSQPCHGAGTFMVLSLYSSLYCINVLKQIAICLANEHRDHSKSSKISLDWFLKKKSIFARWVHTHTTKTAPFTTKSSPFSRH